MKPDEETGDPRKTNRNASAQRDDLPRYSWLAFALLVVFTTAILTPDYLNYRYKRAQLEKQETTVRTAPPPSAPAQATPSNVAVSVGSQLANHGGAVVVPDGGRKSESKEKDEAISSAGIFETYGKLITMLLGFVSVIGVLASYFVRKSMREVTEDVRGDVERELDRFLREKDFVLEQTKDALVKAKESFDAAAKLKEDYAKKISEAEKVLGAMEDAIRREQEKSTLPSSKDTAKAVDAQLREAGL